jgi:hypothetical protein
MGQPQEIFVIRVEFSRDNGKTFEARVEERLLVENIPGAWRMRREAPPYGNLDLPGVGANRTEAAIDWMHKNHGPHTDVGRAVATTPEYLSRVWQNGQ